MRLKEILQKMCDENQQYLLQENGRNWQASALLKELPESTLNIQAYMQYGIYIAEIDNGGYLGRVLYRLNKKN
jgi:hypothetical protein